MGALAGVNRPAVFKYCSEYDVTDGLKVSVRSLDSARWLRLRAWTTALSRSTLLATLTRRAALTAVSSCALETPFIAMIWVTAALPRRSFVSRSRTTASCSFRSAFLSGA